MELTKKMVAEFIGTFALVVFGCGTAVITDSLITIALAFGISLLVMYYAIGKVSGCHINPAVTIAMIVNGSMKVVTGIGYMVAQVLGGIAGAAFLKYFILEKLQRGIMETEADAYAKEYIDSGYATGTIEEVKKSLGLDNLDSYLKNIGANSIPSEKLVIPCAVLEIFLTFIFVLVVCKVATSPRYAKIGGVVIGLALTLVHIVGIQFTGTSVNPARSIGPAIFTSGYEFKHLLVFIVAPLIGGVIASLVSKYILTDEKEETITEK